MATIDKRGKSWRVQIRKSGITKTRSFKYEKEAREWAERIEGLLVNDLLPHQAKFTLREALERYRDEHLPKLKGAKSAGSRIRSLMKEDWAAKPITDIRPHMLAQYRDRLLGEGYSTSHVNNMLRLLSGVYVLAAQEWGYEQLANPVRNVKKPKRDPARDRRISQDEENLITDEWRSPYVEVFKFCLETSMRRGETLKMTWRNVDLDNKLVHLPAGITKTNKARSVPLSSKAVAVLEGLDRDTSTVFNVTPLALETSFIRLVKRLGIEDLHFHDSRHEAISRLFEKGLSAEEVMMLSGHITYNTLAKYTHLKPASVLDKLG